MQRFEDANEIDAAFAKRHITELSGTLLGHWLGVFQVDRGDTVNAQFQFGGNIIALCAEVADVRVDGEPRRGEHLVPFFPFADGVHKRGIHNLHRQHYL